MNQSRRQLWTCVLLALALALAVEGCGAGTMNGPDGGSGSANSPAPSVPTAPATAAASRCRALTQPGVRALDALRARLLRPIPYRGLVSRLRRVRRIIRRLPLEMMTLACPHGTATRVQAVFNEYSYSVNAWTVCLEDPRCDLEANEPVVQRKWWVAGLLLSELHREAGSRGAHY